MQGFSRSLWKQFARVALMVVAFHVLLLVFPPIAIGAGLALLIAAVFCLFTLPNHILTVVSLVLTVGAIDLGLRVLAVEALSPFYQFHEVIARENSRYLPNQNFVMDERYGDLVAMDPTLASQVAVPRRVEVVTDLFGFRNARSFADQRIFVVGDSFVAGIGVTQAQTITEQLRTDFKIDAVNLGYPAEPIHYGRRIAWARN